MGRGEGYEADLGLEGSLQRAEGSRVWEQRGHAWHGGGVGGEKLGDTKIKSNSATNRTQAYAHTDPRHYKWQHSNRSDIWFAKCSQQTGSRDGEETHIWVSDEWIVQFGGVLVELENIRQKIISEQKAHRTINSLMPWNISLFLPLSHKHTQNKNTWSTYQHL